MASIQETLYAVLAADTAVTDLVGLRIYPGEIPDDEAVAPWLYYAVPSTSSIDEIDDTEQSAMSTVEFHALADTYATAKAILDAVYAALNGYIGGQVIRALWSETTEETTEDGYHHSNRFTVWWTVATIVASPGSSARITTGLSSITLTAGGHTVTLSSSGLTLDGEAVLTVDAADEAYQPLSGGLTSLDAAEQIGLYYFAGAGWSPVSIGSGLDFTAGTLTATAVVSSPNAFTIPAVTGATAGVVTTSSTVTLAGPSGVSDTWSVTVDAAGSPQVQVNGGSWTDSRVPAAAARSGDTLTVRVTAPSAGTTRTVTVRVGGRAVTWSVTSAAWSPGDLTGHLFTTVAGPAYCFSDAAGTVPCGDGDLVRVWRDLAGVIRWTQATSSDRPTLRLSGGKWVVRGDGNNDWMDAGDLSGSLPSAATVALRYAIGDFPTVSLIQTESNDSWDYYNGNVYAGELRGTRLGGPTPIPSAGTHTLLYRSSASGWNRRLDGTTGLSSSADYAGGTRWRLLAAEGSPGAGNRSFAAADVAAVTVVASALSDADAALLETYLAALLP